MRGFNYDRLKTIMETEKPYRGTTNRFPLSIRKQNLKNFYVREENGVIVFDVTCGTRWQSTVITKEEYDAERAMGKNNVHEYTHSTPHEYIRYEHPVHILGTSRPDGFFEFNAEGNYAYGQGEKRFLSDFCSGWFANDSRRGGMTWTTRYHTGQLRIMPIYKGMKVSTDDRMTSKDEYVVIGKKVDRKVGKEVLAGYERFYKVSETMCKAMDRDAFIRTAKEVLEEHKHAKDFEVAEALRDEAPLDAMILYAVALDVGRIQQQITHPQWGHTEPIEVFDNLKRHLTKRVYKEHREVFKDIRYSMNEVYPPSIWGYEIEVNGEIVQQY